MHPFSFSDKIKILEIHSSYIIYEKLYNMSYSNSTQYNSFSYHFYNKVNISFN